MNDLYRKTFDEIHASAALRQEVLNMTKQEKAVVKRQIPRVLLIAAILVLVLAGTALAAAAPGIRQWFSQQWAEKTGRPVHTDQLGLIDRLTDAVGASAQSGGVTVAVDSVTRGEDVIWFLLEIGGDLPSREDLAARLKEAGELPEDGPSSDAPAGCLFETVELAFDPAVLGEKSGYSLSEEQAGIRADGTMMLLMEYQPLEGNRSLLEAAAVTMELSGLEMGIISCDTALPVAEGPWELAFSLPAMEPPPSQTKAAGPGQAPGVVPLNRSVTYGESLAMDPPARETMAFQDIRVTPTGFTILWSDPEQTTRLFPPPGLWYLVMEDGSELRADPQGAVYDNLPDGQRATKYRWPVPVDLTRAASLERRYKEERQSFPLN